MDDANQGQEGARTQAAPEFPAPMLDLAGKPVQLDLLGAMAETSNARRRGAGRPEGAVNKRNDETFDYLEARGFKAPEVLLMEVISADVKLLANKLGADPIEVLKLQIKAAADLMPYKLARKPQAFEVTKRELHMFVAGKLTPEIEAQIEQNQWVTVGDAVRQDDNSPHDLVNIEQVQNDSINQAADHKSAG
jgi:hypothetical protein